MRQIKLTTLHAVRFSRLLRFDHASCAEGRAAIEFTTLLRITHHLIANATDKARVDWLHHGLVLLQVASFNGIPFPVAVALLDRVPEDLNLALEPIGLVESRFKLCCCRFRQLLAKLRRL